MPKRFIMACLSFTRKERKSTFILLLLLLCAVLLPSFFPLLYQSKWAAAAPPLRDELGALQLIDKKNDRQWATHTSHDRYTTAQNDPASWKTPAGELFAFDPNTLDAAGWKRLGLRDKTITTIQNYLSKGGHFYKPEDIGKIWGLHEDEVERLLPYVTIAQPTRSYGSNNVSAAQAPYPQRPAYKPATVSDVNTADTTAFIALPGIGSKLAARIITFRDKLGGFYKAEQVAETYGLADSVYQRIKDRLHIEPGHITQININTATVEQLKAHPYIRYALANALVQYRNQHGPYAAVADIKKIMLVTEEVYEKAAPYLKVE